MNYKRFRNFKQINNSQAIIFAYNFIAQRCNQWQRDELEINVCLKYAKNTILKLIQSLKG